MLVWEDVPYSHSGVGLPSPTAPALDSPGYAVCSARWPDTRLHLHHPYWASEISLPVLTASPPHLHEAQPHGSTESPKKALCQMVCPDFIAPESYNKPMKFREKDWGSWDLAPSLSQRLRCPNPCEIWAWTRQPLCTGNTVDFMP